MKQDVIDALTGKTPSNVPSKETLNHPALIKHVTGIHPFEDTPAAFQLAYQRLGIDIHMPLPAANAARPQLPGGAWQQGNYRFSDMGVYPSPSTVEYCPHLEKNDPNWVFNYDPSGDGFARDAELANLDPADLQASFRPQGGLQGEGRLGTTDQLRQIDQRFTDHVGPHAVMYHLYYTTLFMWPVMKFGWEPFLMAAALEPERFDKQLWQPWTRISRQYFEIAAQLQQPVIFCHDDLTISTGPVFAPDFYERYIFPRYEFLFEPLVQAGKKIVFVCDGNMDVFLDRLLQLPIDAIMFENPATPFERVLETYGRAGKGFIGGIATAILTQGTPDDVRQHTRAVIEQARQYPGFIISSCGGLHGNIPLDNLLAYFQTRNDMGIPAQC